MPEKNRKAPSVARFVRDLLSVCPRIRQIRRKEDGRRSYTYEGIQLKPNPALDWLRQQLASGPLQVHIPRRLADAAGFTATTLYGAMRISGVEEYEEGGRKWWRLRLDWVRVGPGRSG